MEENRNIKERFKTKISIDKMIDERNKLGNTYPKKMMKKWIGIAGCLVFVLTGFSFSQSIEELIIDKFGLGQGIETARKNGYSENIDMNFEESKVTIYNCDTDNIELQVKIKEFLYDDYNLSMEFEIYFNDEAKKYIDIDKLNSICLDDLVIVDENKRIIFNQLSKEDFEQFCDKNNLTATWGNYNENYINNGLNSFINKYGKDNNYVSLIYNMYGEKYPNSKELNLEFTKINLINKNGESIILNGNWNMHIDIPEKMSNRTAQYYKVISCDNSNFDIYTAKLTDTGFELGITIADIERPIYPKELFEKEDEITSKFGGFSFSSEEEFLELFGDEKYWEMFVDYGTKANPINITGVQPYTNNENSTGCYVKNENNKIFACSTSPSRKSNCNFINEDTFDFYETFEMTKYDATPKISVIIDFYNKPVKIELEKK